MGERAERIMTESEAAEYLRCDPRDVKRAWRQGLLRGARIGRALRFRVEALDAFMAEEEERWRARNSEGRGSAGSTADPAGTSTITTRPPDGTADEQLALTIARELRKPSGNSSSNVRELRSRPPRSRPSDTR